MTRYSPLLPGVNPVLRVDRNTRAPDVAVEVGDDVGEELLIEDHLAIGRMLPDAPWEYLGRPGLLGELPLVGGFVYQFAQVQRSGSLTILCDMQLCMTYSATS